MEALKEVEEQLEADSHGASEKQLGLETLVREVASAEHKLDMAMAHRDEAQARKAETEGAVEEQARLLEKLDSELETIKQGAAQAVALAEEAVKKQKKAAEGKAEAVAEVELQLAEATAHMKGTQAKVFELFMSLNSDSGDTVLTADELGSAQAISKQMLKRGLLELKGQLDADGDDLVTAKEFIAAFDLDGGRALGSRVNEAST